MAITLKSKATDEVVRMRNGQPFVYSTRELALLGKKLLEGERKEALVIVGA